MKKLISFCAALFLVCQVHGQTPAIDQKATSNSAGNGGASVFTGYTDASPAVGELVLVAATWWTSDQTSTAKLTDQAGNHYQTLAGPINNTDGVARHQIWWTINHGYTKGWTLTTSAPTATRYFNGAFIQIISFSGVSGIDSTSLAIVQGTGTSFSVTSGALRSSNEMVLGVFLEDGPGTPYSAETGFTGIDQGEAVSFCEYKKVLSTNAVTITGSANTSSHWLGVAVGLPPRRK